MRLIGFLTLALIVTAETPAMAYVGPGLGLGVIGVVGGMILAMVLALYVLISAPIRRALRKRKQTKGDDAG